MRIFWILLFLIFLTNLTFAIEIDELDTTDNQDIILDDRELLIIQKMATLESKINNLPSQSDVEQYNTIVYQQLSKEFRDKTDFMILAIIMSLFFVLGIATGLFIYLKSRRRL